MRAVLLLSLFIMGIGAADRPNVVLICVDDLKPTIGCFGDAFAKTPNIDRLAQRGVTFLRSYTQQAVCAPSRHSLMTGYRSDQLGIYDLATNFRRAKPDAVTISQTFMAAGYYAEGMGKIYHQGHGNGDDPASWSVPHWSPKGDAPAVADGAPQMPPGSKEVPPKPGEKKRDQPWGWPSVNDDACKDGKTAAHAVERITALAKTKQPFFLGVGFSRPHLPFIVPKKYWDLFQKVDLPQWPVDAGLPDGAPNFAGHTFGELRNYSNIQATGALTAAQARTMVRGYYASTAFVDAQIGRVIDAIDQNGLGTNTIIVLWGDHGWHLGDHGLWCKHTNYEQASRIPLIISAPGKVAGQSTMSFAATIDIYPTLCALAGLTAPADLPGHSLVPVLKDTQASVQDHVVHVYPRSANKERLLGRAVRVADWRYVEWRAFDAARSLRAEELYDLKNDPDETVNLAQRPEHKALIAELAAKAAAMGEAKEQIR